WPSRNDRVEYGLGRCCRAPCSCSTVGKRVRTPPKPAKIRRPRTARARERNARPLLSTPPPKAEQRRQARQPRRCPSEVPPTHSCLPRAQGRHRTNSNRREQSSEP